MNGGAQGRRAISALLLASCLALSSGLALTACSRDLGVPPVNVARPPAAVAPKAPDLTSPKSAVSSYLDWVSYAYRVGRAQEASLTATAAEQRRIAAYIEYDKQQGRLVDQRLTEISFGTSVEATSTDKMLLRARVLLPAIERWTYRYIDRVTGAYQGPERQASLDATYTLVSTERGWLVSSVETTATPARK